MNQTTEAQGEDLAGRVAAGRAKILDQLRLVIVGQDEVVDQVLIALFTGGHCFREDDAGTIRVGKRADLTVMDVDPFRADGPALRRGAVLLTLSRGRVTFQR